MRHDKLKLVDVGMASMCIKIYTCLFLSKCALTSASADARARKRGLGRLTAYPACSRTHRKDICLADAPGRSSASRGTALYGRRRATRRPSNASRVALHAGPAGPRGRAARGDALSCGTSGRLCSHSATALEHPARHVWPTPSFQRNSTGTYRRLVCAAGALSTLIVGRVPRRACRSSRV